METKQDCFTIESSTSAFLHELATTLRTSKSSLMRELVYLGLCRLTPGGLSPMDIIMRLSGDPGRVDQKALEECRFGADEIVSERENEYNSKTPVSDCKYL